MSADSECATCVAKPGEACFYQYPSDLHDRMTITAATIDGIKVDTSRPLLRYGRYTAEILPFGFVFRFDGYVVPRYQVTGNALMAFEMRAR